jgi:hypothetical protein
MLTGLLLSNPLSAANQFQSFDNGTTISYNFAFTHPQKRTTEKLSITMPKNWLEFAYKQQSRFDALQSNQSLYTEDVQKHLQNWVREYNRRAGREALKVSFNRNHSLEVAYIDQADHQAFNTYREQVEKRAQKLSNVMRVNAETLMIDYNHIVSRYQRPAREIMEQIIRQVPYFTALNYREQVEWLAYFIQSIPYQSPPTSFRHPVSVLHEYKGDCDEKSVLLGLLIKSLPASKNVSLMYLNKALNGEDHMIIMVEMPGRTGDIPITIKGTRYIPIETTTSLRIGSLPREVLRQIDNEQFGVIGI